MSDARSTFVFSVIRLIPCHHVKNIIQTKEMLSLLHKDDPRL